MGLPEGAIFEVSYIGKLLNQLTMNVRHYYVAAQSTTPSYIEEVENILGYFSDQGVGSVLPAYLGVLPENLTVQQVVVQVLTPSRFRKQFETLNQGGLGPETAVSNVQASITFTTRLSGRDQQGGMRVPASPANAEAGNWSAAYQTDLTTLAARLSESFTEPDGDGIYAPCIYHRTKAAPANRTEIFAFIVQPTTRVIRRRTLGVGK